MKPKISVITICYNAEKEIEKTMVSVLDQSFNDYEYIIVDGASRDHTMNRIHKVLDKYPACNVEVTSEPDRGIYDAMNKGIKKASGEWVILMNSGDTFLDDNVLENVFSRKIPEDKTFLYSDAMCILADGKKFLGDCNFEKGQLLHQSIIYRRALHDEHGYYIVTPKLIISDYLFFVRIPKEQVMKIDTVICLFEGGGVSQQFRSGEYALCADYIFHRRTFANMCFTIIKGRLKDLVPKEIRLKLKSIFQRNSYIVD